MFSKHGRETAPQYAFEGCIEVKLTRWHKTHSKEKDGGRRLRVTGRSLINAACSFEAGLVFNSSENTLKSNRNLSYRIVLTATVWLTKTL